MNMQIDRDHNSTVSTKVLKVLPHMCTKQKEDLEKLLSAADDIGQAATSFIAGGGMGYTQLFEARDRFKTLLLSSSKKYRICVEEEIE